jgi:drug/metabolite transporter (DMT)-like permease
MLYILGLAVAVQVVLAQMLWKIASMQIQHDLAGEALSSKAVWMVGLSWKIWLGLVLYGIATVLFIWLFGKYPYFIIQSFVTSCTLILTLLASLGVFHERISVVNFLGVICLLFGIFLVAQKT